MSFLKKVNSKVGALVSAFGLFALTLFSQVTMSGTVITLEQSDITQLGGGITGMAQSMWNIVFPMLPYILGIIAAFVGYNLLKSTIVNAMKRRK